MGVSKTIHSRRMEVLLQVSTALHCSQYVLHEVCCWYTLTHDPFTSLIVCLICLFVSNSNRPYPSALIIICSIYKINKFAYALVRKRRQEIGVTGTAAAADSPSNYRDILSLYIEKHNPGSCCLCYMCSYAK